MLEDLFFILCVLMVREWFMWFFCLIMLRYFFKFVVVMFDLVWDFYVRLFFGYVNVFVLFKLYKMI